MLSFLKKCVLALSVLCMGVVLYGSSVEAGPMRPIVDARCPMVQSDGAPDRWVYTSELSSVVFTGTALAFAIDASGTPDMSRQEIYFGGFKVPQEEVQIPEVIQTGPNHYWYQVMVPIKYAKYGMVNIPVRGVVGGLHYINLPMIQTKD